MTSRQRLPARRFGFFAVPLLACLGLPAAAAGDPLASCGACHGAEGRVPAPGAPWLGGQPAFYVLTQLSLFREGQRRVPEMVAIARGLSDDEMIELADRVAALPAPPPPAASPDEALLARGRAAVARERCAACHGADFAGGEQVPRLAHQREDYLLASLRAFKRGTRVGYGPAMVDVMAQVPDDELPAIAHYLAHLGTPMERR